LRSLGRQGLGDLVKRNCDQARRFAAAVARDPRARVLNDVVLNQVLIRFDVPGHTPEMADTLVRDVIAAVQAGGTCWLGGTTWHGVAAIRVAVSNWSTTDEDIDRSAKAVLDALTLVLARS
jgi:glutamate/tyrosine decarboxylase-like PLP-dependent enzyme